MAKAMIQRRVPVRTPRIVRERPNWVDILSERAVREKYRLSKALIQHLHDAIEEDIRPKTQRSHSINSITKFLAKGEFYSEGGLTHGVSKSSICRCIWQINPTTRQEIAYNQAHSRTRMVVQRAFGLLKSRFRCLHKTGGYLQFSPEKCAVVFVVCAKLHNMCIDDGMPVENIENDNENNNDMIANFEPNALPDREALINTF